jgi:hypothetical protein
MKFKNHVAPNFEPLTKQSLQHVSGAAYYETNEDIFKDYCREGTGVGTATFGEDLPEPVVVRYQTDAFSPMEMAEK